MPNAPIPPRPVSIGSKILCDIRGERGGTPAVEADMDSKLFGRRRQILLLPVIHPQKIVKALCIMVEQLKAH